ncbi:hypothetical protein [Nocardia sp. SSK8]|uniref:hypothetical protein n=1 Tax=Nocardia sp. SSK8 TaxID=3120154 RepID=UPI00300A34ED
MSDVGRDQDEATRFLSAAVHLDPRLADRFINEFLAEPKRSVPPSPGVQAELVLREAVAARAQRRKLNAYVVGGAVVFLLAAAPLMMGWLLSALSWRLLARVVAKFGPAGSGSVGRSSNWALTATLWWLLSFLWAWPLAAGYVLLGLNDSATVMISLSVALVAALGIYLTLTYELFVPWQTATAYFRFHAYDPSVSRRADIMAACARYEKRLRRIAAEDARRAVDSSGEVIVYRGDAPFLGAGNLVRSWSSAFQLRAKDDTAAEVPRFRPSELQDYVSARVAELTKAEFLTPGSRFNEATVTQWAIVPAWQLPYQRRADAMLHALESDTDPVLGNRDWAELADCSPEWMRYFRCFRVEGWGRQLGVSGYLHVGCVERMLVVEWHGFVLAPIAGRFRGVDRPPPNLELKALGQAASALALLPLNLVARTLDLWRSISGSEGSGGRWSSPTEAAEVFGSRASMRELAAGLRLNSFFQESDSDRYLKIMERCVLDAIQKFLEERGIAAEGLREMVTQINNSTVLNNSQVIAGNVGGTGNIGSIDNKQGAADGAGTE